MSGDTYVLRPLDADADVQGRQARRTSDNLGASRTWTAVWVAAGARAMKDADLEEVMHALWQPEDFAGRQRRPHAAEYDDDECGATALMEGVGATAYGRFDATAPGEYGWDRIARQPPLASPILLSIHLTLLSL